MKATIYHGTPLTPNAAFDAVMPRRAACVSFARPDQAARAEAACPHIMYENGEVHFWLKALKRGEEWDDSPRDHSALYAWLDQRIWHPGRWAVIPDRPGAPSQLNDALLKTWPFGRSKGAPLWHMDGPIGRLGRLCQEYDRVCLGWIGDWKKEPVGCDSYRRKMDEVGTFLGNRFPPLHMMRGVAVARDYPFHRQRGLDQPRAERVALRLHGRTDQARLSLRPHAGPGALDRPQLVRRQAGGK